EASTELRVRLLAASFEDTTRDDLPIAVDLLTRAQYFLLVLDETPPDGVSVRPDGGTVAEAVLATTHSARGGLWRVSDGKQILRIRREAGGQLMGAAPPSDPDVFDARQRQANSCALALAVRATIGETAPASAP